jgi:UDP-N-acetylmuramate dehydrogenase
LNIKEILEKTNISKENIKYEVPMKDYTSFKTGGNAECLIRMQEIKEIQELLEISEKHKIPLTIIGNGSNILIKDKGIKGIVLKIDIKKAEIEIEGEKVILTVGSGNKLGEIAQKLLKQDISGFEFASGIPGTIGGAIRMNAGAHGTEMKDIVKTITYINKNDRKIYKIENGQAKFEYRKSIFSNNENIILEAEIELKKGSREEIQEKMQEYSKYRKEKQPIEYPSAGSTFKRGKDFITAKIIDECGLKGYKIGGAQISEKHAGFIVNTGNATSKDIIELIEYTKREVYNKLNKKIEIEIEIIGEE